MPLTQMEDLTEVSVTVETPRIIRSKSAMDSLSSPYFLKTSVLAPSGTPTDVVDGFEREPAAAALSLFLLKKLSLLREYFLEYLSELNRDLESLVELAAAVAAAAGVGVLVGTKAVLLLLLLGLVLTLLTRLRSSRRLESKGVGVVVVVVVADSV